MKFSNVDQLTLKYLAILVLFIPPFRNLLISSSLPSSFDLPIVPLGLPSSLPSALARFNPSLVLSLIKSLSISENRLNIVIITLACMSCPPFKLMFSLILINLTFFLSRVLTVTAICPTDRASLDMQVDAFNASLTGTRAPQQDLGKDDFLQILSDAREKGILVVASTQCFTGSVMMGHYATGLALEQAGVVSANDMTLEAIACKCAYLFGRGDLTNEEVGNLLSVSIRGEVTPADALSPPPLSSTYQRASRKGKKYL